MTTANLNAAVATGGKELLGFQEPDLASGADMTVQASACCRLSSTCSSSSSRVLSHEKAATCYSDRRACMPQAAISLWPQLEATGLTLVSPAVASNAATSGSWLDQFMVQVAAGGLRVDAIALHWFGTDFADPGASTAQLQANISAVYARYQRPIWLTQVLACACSVALECTQRCLL